MDDQNVVLNSDNFECQICFTECNPGEGLLLHECLHEFCKDCISGCVKATEGAEVECPFNDGNYKCNKLIQVKRSCVVYNIIYI